MSLYFPCFRSYPSSLQILHQRNHTDPKQIEFNLDVKSEIAEGLVLGPRGSRQDNTVKGDISMGFENDNPFQSVESIGILQELSAIILSQVTHCPLQSVVKARKE